MPSGSTRPGKDSEENLNTPCLHRRARLLQVYLPIQISTCFYKRGPRLLVQNPGSGIFDSRFFGARHGSAFSVFRSLGSSGTGFAQPSLAARLTCNTNKILLFSPTAGEDGMGLVYHTGIKAHTLLHCGTDSGTGILKNWTWLSPQYD